MNVYFLDRDPLVAARLHSDIHVVKMASEAAQILCTALRRHGLSAPWKPTHARHPSVLWAGDSLAHWQWVRRLGLALCDEYEYRFGRPHAARAVIDSLPVAPPLPDAGWADPPQAMPDHCKRPDPVEGYRAYYALEKAVFPHKGEAKWTRRERPGWMTS